ncbi:hypothetical protein FOL46_008060 [Perkinsus olseni]|uniref:Uncharacterized protein n=2 Tax=Perkinsus olseni TaxID=32597 RepID=A0A7J6L9T5_PEROL|nr:hypothetical protein FOL46_008060 [Perkinsus olseni]
MKFFKIFLAATTMSTRALFIGKYKLQTPRAEMSAEISEAGEIGYTLSLPGQDSLVSAQYPLVEAGPGKYFVDFQAKDGGSLSDLQIQSANLGFGLSVINVVGSNSLRVRSGDGFVTLTRDALPLSEGTYVYSEGDSFKLTMEVAAELSEEARRQVKVTVSCSLGRTILRATELSTTFELDERPIAADVSTTVGDFFESVGETCSRTGLKMDNGILVVAAATETRVYLEVGETSVFALDRVE